MKKSDKLQDRIVMIMIDFWERFNKAKTREEQLSALEMFIRKLERQYWSHKLAMEGVEIEEVKENG